MEEDLLNISGDVLDSFKDAAEDMTIWIEELMETMKCKSSREFTVERLMNKNKETLAKLLLKGYAVASSYQEEFENARRQVENMKSELIESQRKVVKLQRDQLDIQAEQLKSMSTVVDNAVEKGIRTYSQAVSESLPQPAPGLSEENLKRVVKEAVSGEDRSKNIMVFGLKEETGENVKSRITAMFSEISQKPTFEAARVGKETKDKIRPIKVSLRNSSTVHQILVKAKELKSSNHHRTVYITPDRSPDERVKHKELIAELKRISKEDHSKHYYVRSGQIFSRDKG